MNLNTLPIFTAIIQNGSLSKTSDKLGIPIATISRQLAELEKSLGVQLFDRQKTGVKPTNAGQKLYEEIHQNVDNLGQILGSFGQNDGKIRGNLRISTPAGMSEIWAWIDEFCEQNQQVTVNLYATDRVLDLVEDGIDFAFRVGELHTDTAVAKPVMTLKTKWVACPDILAKFGTPKTLSDLAKFPLVGFANPHKKTLTIPNGKKPLHLPYIFASNDVYALENAVKNGRGIGLLSQSVADRLIRENGLVEVLSGVVMNEFVVHLLYVKHRHQSLLMRTFVDFILVKAENR